MSDLSQTSPCVVITGSTRGIGLGLARAFLAQGCNVLISGRDPESLQRALTQLGTTFDGARLHGLCSDVTCRDSLQALWHAGVARFGKVDVWINNAGSCHAARDLVEIAGDELESVVRTNIMGSIFGSQVALSAMLEQGGGQIFNMEGWGSQGEWSAGMTVYSTSKRAVSHFSKGLYKETRNSTVLVGTLSPGMVATDLLVSSWKEGNAQNWQKMKRLFLFVIDPPEIVCAYLARRILANRRSNARIVWMTPQRLIARFFQPYYWRRNPVAGTALESLGEG